MSLDVLNSPSNDFVGSLSPDELTLYMSSDRTGPGSVGGFDVYVAVRSSRDADFGAPSLLAGINTAADEKTPLVTGDGLFMYVSTHTESTAYDILVAQRPSTTISFSSPTLVPSLNTTDGDAPDYVLPDHTAIYLHSNRNGPLQSIYRAARNPGGTFDTPVAVNIPPMAGDQATAALTPDELTIFYTSNAPGGQGGYDIYMAKRSTKADGFGTAQPQAVLNSGDDEFPGWISPDGCELYFTRTPPGGYADIFLARRGQ